ncbi:MAG: PD-(D/E)XK nuclease family protein [Comamonadaceae bacterium]|nr:PD-(D/E)XK nuclease family protein [Comamonadaceae bacterium]
MTANVLPWSYSTLSAFETCPLRYYYTRVTRQVQEALHPAVAAGNRTHKLLEDAVSRGAHLPPDHAHHAPLVDYLRTLDGQKLCEYKFAVTAGGAATTFFSKTAWYRGVIDLAVVRPDHTALLLDYKIGKIKENHDQLELFALAGFAIWPHLEEIHTSYVWLQHGKQTRRTYNKADAPEIKSRFIPRVERMQAAAASDNWPARPSGLCKGYCPVGKKLCAHCGLD